LEFDGGFNVIFASDGRFEVTEDTTAGCEGAADVGDDVPRLGPWCPTSSAQLVNGLSPVSYTKITTCNDLEDLSSTFNYTRHTGNISFNSHFPDKSELAGYHLIFQKKWILVQYFIMGRMQKHTGLRMHTEHLTWFSTTFQHFWWCVFHDFTGPCTACKTTSFLTRSTLPSCHIVTDMLGALSMALKCRFPQFVTPAIHISTTFQDLGPILYFP